MAIKKKLVASLSAVAITAMCLGGTALAADAGSKSINGSGTGFAEESSDVNVTYTKAAPGTATWAVTMPQKLDFGAVNSAASTVTKLLEYSALINIDGVSPVNQVESLRIALKEDQSFSLTDAADGTIMAEKAYSFKKLDNTEINDEIAILKKDEKASINAVLSVDKLKIVATDNTTHNFTGKFTVKITPVVATAP